MPQDALPELTSARLERADWIVIVGYFALMLFIGAYFFRYMKKAKSYFSGGNTIPWWVSGVSLYMTSFSAFAFVAYSAMGYRFGLVPVTYMWLTVGAFSIGAFYMGSRWRRARIGSPVEFLENRYHPLIRQLLAWVGIPFRTIDNGLRTLALGSLVAGATDLSISQSILLCGSIVLASTFLGGLWAAMITDFVQFIIMVFAVILLVPLSIHRAGGMGVFSRLPETTWRLTAGPYTPFYLFTVFCLFAINYNSNWALAQRYYCVRDEREARRVGLLAAGLSILGPPLFFLPAILARDFLPGLEDPNTCYSRVVVTVLPAGMIGVVMAAMFSATMSTLSSEYSVMANVLTTDIYRRLIRRNASDRELVVVGMIMTVVVGLLTMGLGLYLAAQAKDKALFDRMIQVFSIGLGPMAVPFLLGLISRRYGWRAALAGILGGLTVGLSMYVYQLRVFVPSLETLKAAEPILRETRMNTYTGWTTLASIGGTLLFMEIAQRLMGWAPGERERVDTYFARVSRPVERSEVPDVPPEEGPSVFHIVGLSILGAGVMILLAGFAASSELSRRINLGTGAALAALGLAMWRPWKGRVLSL